MSLKALGRAGQQTHVGTALLLRVKCKSPQVQTGLLAFLRIQSKAECLGETMLLFDIRIPTTDAEQLELEGRAGVPGSVCTAGVRKAHLPRTQQRCPQRRQGPRKGLGLPFSGPFSRQLGGQDLRLRRVTAASELGPKMPPTERTAGRDFV